MTEKELNEIGEYIINNVMKNEEIMFSDTRIRADLPSIIASLYEVLYREITGKPYQYFFHFANKIGSDVDDDLFTNYIGGGKNGMENRNPA